MREHEGFLSAEWGELGIDEDIVTVVPNAKIKKPSRPGAYSWGSISNYWYNQGQEPIYYYNPGSSTITVNDSNSTTSTSSDTITFNSNSFIEVTGQTNIAENGVYRITANSSWTS